jgi:hypothetical protein
MNFSQALESQGIIEAKALANLSRRRTMMSRQDRPKVWPGKKGVLIWSQEDFTILTTTSDPEKYVRAWCKLNKLKH